MRGSDVVKAVCLGARAVLIGKLMAWGLAAGGVDVLVRTPDILREEIVITMAQLGARSVAQLGPDLVRSATPPPPAPWPVAVPARDVPAVPSHPHSPDSRSDR